MECTADLDLDDRAAPASAEADAVDLQRPLGTTVWSTASGKVLHHVVYSLIGCPPVKAATYLLVRHALDGTRTVLAVRATRSRFAGVNLARIRRAGARWGANEVHLFRGGGSQDDRDDLVSDLCRALRVPAPRRPSRKRSARLIRTLGS